MNVRLFLKKQAKALRRVFRRDGKIRLLSGAVVIAGFCAVLGLYLILVQDAKIKAQWSAGAGTIYFLQSSKQGFKGGFASEFLEKAYEAHQRAVTLSPYDASLWIRFAYVLAARRDTVVPALEALDIAQALQPDQSRSVQAHRAAVVLQFKRFRSGQMNVQPLLDTFDDSLNFRALNEEVQ